MILFDLSLSMLQVQLVGAMLFYIMAAVPAAYVRLAQATNK